MHSMKAYRSKGVKVWLHSLLKLGARWSGQHRAPAKKSSAHLMVRWDSQSRFWTVRVSMGLQVKGVGLPAGLGRRRFGVRLICTWGRAGQHSKILAHMNLQCEFWKAGSSTRQVHLTTSTINGTSGTREPDVPHKQTKCCHSNKNRTRYCQVQGEKKYANTAPFYDIYGFPPRLLIIWGQK